MLWTLRRERRSGHYQLFSPAVGGAVVLVPMVEEGADSGGLARTLHSIEKAAPGNEPIMLARDNEGRPLVANPDRLAKLGQHDSIWVCPMAPGDELAADALVQYAQAIAQSRDIDVFYADDDLLDTSGRRHQPHLKPDWNPELFRHHDYLTGACVLRISPEALNSLPAGNWAEALVRAKIGGTVTPLHVPSILHHRRHRPAPRVPAGAAEFELHRAPAVSLIVPTRNHAELLRTCLEGVERTRYAERQTIVVDNGSDDDETIAVLKTFEKAGGLVLRRPGPFNFSSLNNAAVREARGDFLCFLNNDIEVLSPDWLAIMVAQAQRADVGAVGARLLYPDHTIQHAGVVIGMGGGAGHAHRFQRATDPGYFDRASLPQQVSAVTAACLVVARDKFIAVGGFDERMFPVAFNDVDLCLRLNERGWQSFYEPRATLIHHESKSRGKDSAKGNRDRFARELAALKQRWLTEERADPFHHPYLSRFSEQFVLDV
ncbi:glycosyltransferase family 2 protein [Sphingomonas sp. BN140010]|uniref:Glycosyltransferase family 2 protein n=1 Tax=Sphingomonas arvum TaxID=2992113 RepID=A0ABT3JCA2_9SPHN|nr:glycosyltransferase family 2 protein [Sphingomonas sp. BN140010]MCW3796666.1 glycosyltransferase family 2 protein [Sphingomonas sp. BN140010]